MKRVAMSLKPLLPVETMFGGLLLDLLALSVITLLCFLAGLVAQRATARTIRAKLESFVQRAFPGYSFVKGFADNMLQSDELAKNFIPVVVQFDDYSQLSFEIEHEQSGKVAVYLPGAPNPWSGTVVYVTEDRVKRLQMSVSEVGRNIRMLGKGTVAFEERMKGNQKMEV
jgi:uncharacterized membrane protein